MAVQVDHVSREFIARKRRALALRDVSVTVREREVVGIVGPTGCGKTTLLNLIAGFDTPTSGLIRVYGKQFLGPGPDRGFIFQQPNLFPWLSVRENVAFAVRYGRDLPALAGTRQHLMARTDALIEEVGLSNALHLFPHQISGGMKSRAALARVLLASPAVLLMDEPFAALDAQTRIQMHTLLLHLLRSGEMKTVVLITHDVEEALVLCDRIYILSSSPGQVVAEYVVPFGRPREYSDVARRAEFVELKFEVLGRLEVYGDAGGVR
ncbi:MAG: ABC transporter ATP-binding protein [Candidatus Dormibacteraeota bacterium]|nr:ABC transporter ATP-binding protein [Candidatus Dormibacteraeota bacterium]